MTWYGVDMNNIAADLGLFAPPRSHVSEALSGLANVQMPVRMDPGFDERRTANLGRMVEQWGLVPLAYLAQFAHSDFTYGYIGNQDFTMYPILPPGSFIQVDEGKNKVTRRHLALRIRTSHLLRRDPRRAYLLLVQHAPRGSHSAAASVIAGPVRILRHPQEAEIIGQVVGVAMKLTEWRALEPSPGSKAQPALN